MRILVTGPDDSLVDEMRDVAGTAETRLHFERSDAATVAWQSYDGAVLNFIRPDTRDLELLRLVRHCAPDLPVLIVSSAAPIAFKISALTLGADDYVVRPFDPAELAARVHAVCRRAGRRPVHEAGVGELRLDPVTRSVAVDNQSVTLAAREYDVLELLNERNGNVVSKQALLRHLYNDRMPSGGEVIRVFIHNIRRKLEQVGCTQVINTCRGRGYMLSRGTAKPTHRLADWQVSPVGKPAPVEFSFA